MQLTTLLALAPAISLYLHIQRLVKNTALWRFQQEQPALLYNPLKPHKSFHMKSSAHNQHKLITCYA
jgi:hypothetical protein